MKNLQNLIKTFVLLTLLLNATIGFAQEPTYSCCTKNDTLLNPTTFSFEVWIYRTDSVPLYLNNYQLSLKIQNSSSVLNGGTLTGSYIDGTSQLPAELKPSGVNIFNTGGNTYVRVNGAKASANNTLIPVNGLRIGKFQIVNTVAYANSNINLSWNNMFPATTLIQAMISDKSKNITNLNWHCLK